MFIFAKEFLNSLCNSVAKIQKHFVIYKDIHNVLMYF
nr:MAG TPA: hypothetical protein [Caudoviricetes sp.]DAU38957.1 MAG TPA: hypothetical protein [Caudoviricetes sp.]